MDYAKFYRIHTKQTQEEDAAEIAAGFKDIIKRGARVNFRLVNYYKGLPISYPATLYEFDHGTLELDVHQQQAVALEATRFGFIKCDYFQNPILAEVKNVDVFKMTAALRNFVYVEILAEQRSALRLELDPHTEAEIEADGALLTGKVLDASLGGFSIRTSQPCELAQGTEVTLRVMVPNLLQRTESRVVASGRHIDTVTKEDGQTSRFSIVSDPQNEGLISRFLFQRQVEIIRELKEQS
jgi:hypothetical protein